MTKQFWINTFFWSFCVILVIVTIAIGVVPQICIPQDMFALLETAERMHRGVRPYVDFDTLIGPLTFVPMLISFGFVGVVPYAFVLANAGTIPFIGGLTWYYFLRKRPTIINLLLSIYICLTWSTPVPLHGYYNVTSYGMFYDRVGEALLCLLSLLLLAGETRVSFIFGILVAVLFFIKIPFGISGGILAVLYVIRTNRLVETLLICTGVALMCGLMICYLGLDGIYNMLAYVETCGSIQPKPFIWYRFNQVITDSILFLPLIPIVYFVLRAKLFSWFALATDLVFLLTSALFADFCCTPNSAGADVPCAFIIYFFLLGRLIGHIKIDYFRTPIVTVCAVLMSFNFIRDVMAYCFLIYFVIVHADYKGVLPGGCVDAPGFEHVLIYSNSSRLGKMNFFFDEVNEGLALIAKHPELKHARVACLDFADWFSIARHAPSPDHMPIVVQFGFTIDKNHIPKPEVTLQGCSAIMIPKSVDKEKTAVHLLLKAYEPYLGTHFSKYDESYRWLLLYN